MKKKRVRVIVKETMHIIAVVFCVYLLAVLLFEQVSFLNRYQHYTVVSGSMSPTIEVGDLVLMDERIHALQLEEGDIIAFDVELNDQQIVVIHYVHSVTFENGEFVVLTRPEHSEEADSWTLSNDNIRGIYLTHIPNVGRFLMFAQSPIGRMVVLGDIAVLYIIYRMFKKD